MLRVSRSCQVKHIPNEQSKQRGRRDSCCTNVFVLFYLSLFSRIFSFVSVCLFIAVLEVSHMTWNFVFILIELLFIVSECRHL